MGLRVHVRDEFPRRWWRSKCWWTAWAKDTIFRLVVVFATIFTGMELSHAVRHRNAPHLLVKLDRHLDSYSAAAFLNGALLFSASWLGVPGVGAVLPPLLAGMVTVYALLNLLVSCITLLILIRSRAIERLEWERLDFIEHYAVVHRPPETLKEYEALRLKGHPQKRP